VDFSGAAVSDDDLITCFVVEADVDLGVEGQRALGDAVDGCDDVSFAHAGLFTGGVAPEFGGLGGKAFGRKIEFSLFLLR